MNAKEPSWSVVTEIPAVVLRPQHLRRTVCVAVVVGTSFFAMNQLGIVLAGRATGLVWLKAVLTYLTPLLVSNYGVLSATRRRDSRGAGATFDIVQEAKAPATTPT